MISYPYISTISLISVAIIVLSVVSSACVILIILLVYLLRVVRRKPEPHSPPNSINPAKFPPLTPVPNHVQPPSTHGEGRSYKRGQGSRHSYARIDENLEGNIDASIYGPDMEEFYHNPNPKQSRKSNFLKSLSKRRIHSKSVENLEYEPIRDKSGPLPLNGKFSKSTDHLDSPHRYNRDRSPHSSPTRHTLNCLSVHNINTPPCQTFKPGNRQTWHSHYGRRLSPLLQKSTPSTSSESLDKLEPCHGDDISDSQHKMVSLRINKWSRKVCLLT